MRLSDAQVKQVLERPDFGLISHYRVLSHGVIVFDLSLEISQFLVELSEALCRQVRRNRLFFKVDQLS